MPGPNNPDPAVNPTVDPNVNPAAGTPNPADKPKETVDPNADKPKDNAFDMNQILEAAEKNAFEKASKNLINELSAQIGIDLSNKQAIEQLNELIQKQNEKKKDPNHDFKHTPEYLEYLKSKADLDAQRKLFENQMAETQIQSTLKAVANEHNAINPDDIAIIARSANPEIRIIYQDGQVKLVNNAGNAVYKKGAVTPMTVSDYVKDLLEQRPHLQNNHTNPGTGSKPSTNGLDSNSTKAKLLNMAKPNFSSL